MDPGVSNHDTRLGHVLDGELGATALAGQTADRPVLVVALQRLHVLDLERLDEQVLESQQRQRILDVEAEQESAHKVGRLLQIGDVRRFRANADFHLVDLHVEADLQLQVLDDGRKDLQPVFFQRGVSAFRGNGIDSVN